MTLDKPIAVVKYVDMPVDMQQDAVDLCYQGIENFKEEYEIAKYLKKEYECKYGSIWHCIVGKSFGSFEDPTKLRYKFYENKLNQFELYLFYHELELIRGLL
ncbi:unnamed protein product [Schistosoma bovis]|nr:unnamed protein product [Schistosoma bovis]